MDSYIALKHTHTLLALLSVLGFGLRGHIALVMNRPLINPVIRFGPHVINVIFIVLGLAMWHISKLPLMSWFGLKMVFVLLYFGSDGMAFAQAKKGRRGPGVVLYVLGLIAFLAAAWMAFSKPGL